MKKTFTLALLCIAAAFTSCKKDNKGNNCWKCTVTLTTYEADNGHFTTHSDIDVCDKTEEEIRYYEQARANTANTPDGGRILTEVACTAK